jgi:hypothetical protein
VILFVLFLRFALQAFSGPAVVSLTWLQIATLMTLPISTLLLAIALRLVELHPKPTRPPPASDERARYFPRVPQARNDGPERS